jgi:hypothetical protein
MTTRDVTIRLPKLHASQRRVWTEAARYNVLRCGRRWGKTTLLRYVCGRAVANGLKVGFGAPQRGTAMPVWAEMKGMFDPIITDRREDYMRFSTINGGEFHVWPLDKDLVARGFDYDLFVIDEAAYVRKLMDLWQNAIRPTLTDRQGVAWFVSTPHGRNDFQTLYELGASDDDAWYSACVGTLDNPHMPREDIEQARRELPEEVFRQEYEGIPAANAANPFGTDAIADCVGKMSTDEPVWFGVDIAQSQDWTVIVGLDEQGRVAHFERFQHVPYDEIERRVVSAVKHRVAVIDKTGVGAPVWERIALECSQAEPFTYTANSKQELMHGLRAAIHRNDITYPDGPIRHELDVFQYKMTGTGVRYEAPAGFHDDCVCALAQAVYAMTKHRAEPFVSVIPIRRRQPRIMTGAPR